MFDESQNFLFDMPTLPLAGTGKSSFVCALCLGLAGGTTVSNGLGLLDKCI